MSSGKHRPNWPIRAYAWTAERLYHEFAWAYDMVSWLVSLGRWSSGRKLALQQARGTRVLELGFGTGELLLEMGQQGLWAVGLDPSEQMHRVAARKLRQHGISIDGVRAVSQRMPFASESFDTIISTFPSGYILDGGTMREVARVLRTPNPVVGAPGGRLIIVGIQIQLQHWLARCISCLIFGEPSEQIIRHCMELAITAGLRVEVEHHSGQWASLPVLICEKETNVEEQGDHVSRS